MKIEKISDNQIRCTLTKEDLATRHLKISELAYGTEKAKSLFRDMMQQAAYEFGFEANDIPLMIEAIPLPSESLVLIITKVEDPEELDTRFAKFAPFTGKNGAKHSNSPISSPIEGADDILGLFNKIREAHKQAVEKQAPAKPSPEDAAKAPVNLTRLYKFDRLDTVILAAGILGPIYHGENSLYKDAGSKEYHLLISNLTTARKNSIKSAISSQNTAEDSSFHPEWTPFMPSTWNVWYPKKRFRSYPAFHSKIRTPRSLRGASLCLFTFHKSVYSGYQHVRVNPVYDCSLFQTLRLCGRASHTVHPACYQNACHLRVHSQQIADNHILCHFCHGFVLLIVPFILVISECHTDCSALRASSILPTSLH